MRLLPLKRLLPDPIPRRDGVSQRLVLVGLGGRFGDELLTGLPDVLLPTIRQALGLSYLQISLLLQLLFYVAAVVEPVAGLLLDIWRRKWLMAFGAASLSLGIAVIGLAPSLAILALAYILMGVGSGPLAHTGDVVLVEAHPTAPDRIFTRSTQIDTVGALLAPALVALASFAGLSWRWLMVMVGATGLIYALAILRTRFPGRVMAAPSGEATMPWHRQLRRNLRAVLADRPALTWLAFLFLFDLAEAPFLLKTVWLYDHVGMSQAVVGVYRVMELAVGLASLLVLERLLTRHDPRRILRWAALGVLLLLPAWIGLPGVAARFILGVPLTLLFSVFWPIARSHSLASVPGKAGTVSAVNALFGLAPLAVLVGWLSERFSLTGTMLAVQWSGVLLLLIMTWFLSARPDAPEDQHRDPAAIGRHGRGE